MSGTQHVQNVPENPPNPPGATMGETETHAETQSAENYPAVETKTMTEEELKAQQEAEAAERVERAKRATGPRKLNPNERKIAAWWLEKFIGENDPVDKVIPFDQLEKDVKVFFQPSMQQNVVARGVFNAVYDENTQQLTGAHLTQSGAELYFRSVRTGKAKTDSEPTGQVSRGVAKATSNGPTTSGKYGDNVLLKKLVAENPRRADTHGYFSWMLYRDGMTYNEYMKSKAPEGQITGVGTPFSGPGRNHWDWDLMHGYTALYHKDRPEKLENGEDNPDYWYINNAGKRKAVEAAAEEQEQKENTEATSA